MTEPTPVPMAPEPTPAPPPPGPPAESQGATPSRYAVYFMPAPDSPWAHFGHLWLQGAWQPPGLGLGAWQALLREPRRYGFHATLKAPFRLAPGCTPEALVQRLEALAARLHSVPLGPLAVQAMDGFVALVPSPAPPTPVPPGSAPSALQALADRCVLDLDDLRAPLTPAEWARRQPHRLDERGRALLQAHGYPHVLERFRFHLTLAMTSLEQDAAAVQACVRGPLMALQRQTPLVLDRLCLCVEPAAGRDLVRVRDFELAG